VAERQTMAAQRQWGDQYAQMASQLAGHLGYPGATVRVVPVTLLPDPLIAAKQRLGAWLSAEPCRYWEHGNWRPDGADWVHLCEKPGDPRDIVILGSGEGPDLAAAIMAALEKING
jgi:hypothetical protein